METKQTQTHWKKLTNPNYIGAYSLDEGSELIVKIVKVQREQVLGMDGKKEECTVAHLVGQKPFIINSTNAKAITKAHGTPYIENWAGKLITLYVAKVKAFGDTVEALRVKPTAPVIELPELNPSHPKWEGAKNAIKSGNTTLEAIKKVYSLTTENEIELCK